MRSCRSALPVSRRGIGLVRQFEPGALRQIGHGIQEFHFLVLHEKADHCAVRAASKAVIKPASQRSRKTTATSRCETGSRLCIRARPFFQRHARADDVDDIGTRNEFVEKRVWNPAGHGPPFLNRRAWL